MRRPSTAFLVASALSLSLVPVGALADPASEAQGPAVVAAGDLRAVIGTDRWGLTFTDASGSVVLEEHEATGPGPVGVLGFHADEPVLRGQVDHKPQDPDAPGRLLGWEHATEVLEVDEVGGAVEALVATSDPSRQFAVRVAPDGDGVIEVTAEIVGDQDGVSATRIGFAATEDERFVGFGERSNAVEQRGRTLENYVGEGPFQADEYPVIDLIMPDWGIRWRDDATYYPVPWLLSTRGYGVLLDNDEPSYHRLASDDPDAWSVETEAPSLRLRVFAGPTPAEALERFTAATGRQPTPAPWFLGPWVQARGGTVNSIIELQEADAPVSAAATFLHYLPCGRHEGREVQEQARTASMHDRGVAVLTYFNPKICTDYEEMFERAADAGAFQKHADGSPYVFDAYYAASPTMFLPMSQIDFTAPAGVDLFHELLGAAYSNGYDGWMEDFGEYTPLDAHGHDGSFGWDWHNRYATEFHCAAQEFDDDHDRPLARYVRSGWTGTAPCAPIVWGGDPTTSWGFDGLESAIYNGLSMGTSGVSTWGSDIGGFFALGDNRLTPELLVRWVQFGALTPVMRTQAEGVAIPPQPDRPQVWDEDILPHWRRWAKLHTQLNPYLLAATDEYERTGMPVMRHHVLTHPEDLDATVRDDQYLFGPDLLVAPVIEPETPETTERELYLPEGTWVDLWRSADYDEETGGLTLTGAELLEGRASATVPAPLEELPILVRSGAVLPLLPPDVDTLSDYGRDTDDIVHAADRADELHLLAFPTGTERSALGVAEHVTSTVTATDWTLAFDGERERTYHLQAALGAGELGEPCGVRLDGEPLTSWSYDADGEVLLAEFNTQGGTLEVTACEDEPGPGDPPAPEPCRETIFSDVGPDHPHLEGICRTATERIALGFGDGTFRPTLAVSRGQVASFVARVLEAADHPLPRAGDQGFGDTAGSVHATAVDQLTAVGIIEGVRPGVFQPAAPITRDQFASVLARTVRYLGGQQEATDGPHFSDTAGSVHAGNVDLAYELGLTRGTATPGTFSPRLPTSRAQTATFLARLLDLIE